MQNTTKEITEMLAEDTSRKGVSAQTYVLAEEPCLPSGPSCLGSGRWVWWAAQLTRPKGQPAPSRPCPLGIPRPWICYTN